ncbi:unnamed protein product [Mytilus coruscus]|uniref:Dynamin N-terminal domain-containing protein n=1 Tax=Mytilus coruscus TaxID=42192 RepID=A0A6J8DAM7_MYTCO|nr:unnamed protein product [Mytilus coruscus]
MCEELGQTLNWNGSTIIDRTCRCDYTTGYAFVTEPRNTCFCRPTEEDCMCYKIVCPRKMQLTQDYKCSSGEDLSSPFSCPSIVKTAGKTIASSTIKGNEKILPGKLWTKLLITCPIMIDIHMTESKPDRQKEQMSPREAFKAASSIIEELEKLLSNDRFERAFHEELSAACPNYMNDLKTCKQNLLQNDCSIVITGEKSAGVATLINQLVGTNVFITENLAATGTVFRIRNSESMSLKTYKKNKVTIEQKDAKDLSELKHHLRGHKLIGGNFPSIVDVHLPFPILKVDVIIAGTPSFDDSKELDKILLDFLQYAISFIFIVDANEAEGINKDRVM